VTNKKLNELIHARDNNQCVLCHRWVDPGEKWHHIIFKGMGGGKGENTERNGVTLCQNCHREAHGPEAKRIRHRLQEYIEEIYGGDA
jgi:5-methylcytosine-specific restriction endonuclease McrA